MHLFYISICISGCASIYLDIHLFCRSACLLFSLVCSLVWQCIWQCIRQSGCLAYRSICISGNLAVHSSASARICLPFCPAILFCHSVLPACSAGCASVACLNAYLPLSECLHCCSSIWLPFCLSAGISAQMSVLAAGYLSVWLLVCLSGGLLDRLAICLLVGLFWRSA